MKWILWFCLLLPGSLFAQFTTRDSSVADQLKRSSTGAYMHFKKADTTKVTAEYWDPMIKARKKFRIYRVAQDAVKRKEGWMVRVVSFYMLDWSPFDPSKADNYIELLRYQN